MRLTFSQVDVFSSAEMGGNPVAVVHGADELREQQMAQFAKWTNLSETTFLLNPKSADADYAVRIFTPGGELPFAGHPTLGSCHAWLASRDIERSGEYVQECAIGLVRIRRQNDRLAFAAPPLTRMCGVDPAVLADVRTALGLHTEDVLDAAHLDCGPKWIGILMPSAAKVLGVEPDILSLHHQVGLIGPQSASAQTQFEVRAFAPNMGIFEDPVTGSLNAGLAQWLISTGRAPSSYVVAQGAAIGRTGRVYIDSDGQDIWVGGVTTSRIGGTVRFDKPDT